MTFRNICTRVLVPLAFFASAFVLPLYTPLENASNLLTAVSLLFAILLGFFIATATSNYLAFQAHLSNEGAALVTMYNFGKLARPSAARELADAIDRYVIATLDFSLTDYVIKTNPEFDALVEVVDGIEPDTNRRAAVIALESMHQEKSNAVRARNSITLTAPRVAGMVHWIVILLLTGTLLFLLLGMRTGTAVSAAVSGIIVATLYFILLILYEVDGNKFFEEQLAYQDVQGIFRTIGKLDYYPEFAIAQGLAKTPPDNYRVGIYEDYPASTRKKVKIISSGRKAE